jgi:hypothetical protein
MQVVTAVLSYCAYFPQAAEVERPRKEFEVEGMTLAQKERSQMQSTRMSLHPGRSSCLYYLRRFSTTYN